jgi:hypothetical protein
MTSLIHDIIEPKVMNKLKEEMGASESEFKQLAITISKKETINFSDAAHAYLINKYNYAVTDAKAARKYIQRRNDKIESIQT